MKSKKVTEWMFFQFDPDRDTTGDALRRSQAGSGLTMTQALVREAVQNSADRAKKGMTPSVAFKFNSLTTVQKESFVSALAGLTAVRERDITTLGLASDNCLVGLDDPSKPLRLLWIEDRATEGLTGGDADPGGHFYRLLKQLGGGSVDPNSGGSFGFGKSVYPATSGARIMIAHSRALVDGVERERIFGVGLFNQHKHNGILYTGRAHFGVATGSQNDSQEKVTSVTGDEATQLADQLGFSRRPAGDTGTSILIIDYDKSVTAESLAEETLTWWWPRLVDKELTVDVFEAGVLHDLDINKRADLRPFVDAYALAIGAVEPSSERERRLVPNNVAGWGVPGTLGLTLLSRDEAPLVIGPAQPLRIARMRQTKMVIDYWDSDDRDERAGLYYGAFILSNERDIQEAIGYSEPSTHDRWDKSSSRIMEHPRSEEVRFLVKGIEANLKRALRKFLGEFANDEQKQYDRPRELERMIASILKGPGAAGGHKALPILVTRGEDSDSLQNEMKHAWTRLRLDADDKRCELLEAIEVVLRVRAFVSADGRPDQQQPVPLGAPGEEISTKGLDVLVWVNREQGKKVHFQIAPPADPRWTIAYQIEVAPTGNVRSRI